jgi:3-hydroxyacyl-[acyl-carrier-protein] dehydratase
MKFRQLDEILEIEPQRRIVARRTLRANEEYLEDHFPLFPVMPGVLMLESLFQATQWLVRVSEDFASPLVLLRETRSVKFADFLAPGESLDIEAEWIKTDGPLATFKAHGRKDGKTSVAARLVVEKRPLPNSVKLVNADEIRTATRDYFYRTFGDPKGMIPLAVSRVTPS